MIMPEASKPPVTANVNSTEPASGSAIPVSANAIRSLRNLSIVSFDEQIARKFNLAKALDIDGTPGFIAGKQVVQGLMDAEALKQLNATAREK